MWEKSLLLLCESLKKVGNYHVLQLIFKKYALKSYWIKNFMFFLFERSLQL